MADPRLFTVGGPFEVPTRGVTKRRSLDKSQCKSFWAGPAAGWANEKGCYVFALRRGPGYLPLYVGKTVQQRFEAECFVDRNYRLLHEALDGEPGTLVLFLVKYERTRGKLNGKVIGDVEKFLVEIALDQNPDLKNRVYARKSSGFAIRGVHRAGPGKPSRAATAFKRALGL